MCQIVMATTGGNEMTTPKVFFYTDHQKYLYDLKEHYNQTDEKSSLGSYAGISQLLSGSNTRTKVKKMFTGESTISQKALLKLVDIYNLNKEEIEYVNYLRKFQEVKDADNAVAIYSKVVQARKKHVDKATQLLDGAKIKIYENWYLLPLMFYFDLKDADLNIKNIEAAFFKKLTQEEIEKGIQTLCDLKLIAVLDGKIIREKKFFALIGGVPSPLIKKFHYDMGKKGLHSIYNTPFEKRHLSALTLPVETKKLPLIQEKISRFLMQLNEEFETTEGDGVYQLNMQLFSLAELHEKK